MSRVEQVLRMEMARIARREVKRALQRFTEALRRQRGQLRELKQALAVRRAMEGDGGVVPPGVSEEEVKKARFSGRLIRKMRMRLGLSRGEFAQLAGVSPYAVIGWESDQFRPRGENRRALVALRKIRVRAARRLLEAKKTVLEK
ncbi:MAG: helix-turn-helix domain-containing protein [bacterium]|nr:helix-turn-helix domain-containing protein [bacterium]